MEEAVTITLAPDPRPSDRAPQVKRHEGPYYGYRLREVLADPDEPSIVEREARRAWLWVGIVVVIAAIAFAFVVNL
jgi:hypothetical protein